MQPSYPAVTSEACVHTLKDQGRQTQNAQWISQCLHAETPCPASLCAQVVAAAPSRQLKHRLYCTMYCMTAEACTVKTIMLEGARRIHPPW